MEQLRDQPRYRGRFAPSPTGPLHFGSLVAAVGSWVDARARGGEWLVRMEDLDPPREVPGAADQILRTLDALGLEPDGPLVRQSERADAYRAALDRLRDRGVLFACGCTRREIADSGLPGSDGGLVYPGTCRNGPPPGRPARALRVRVDDAVIAFDDALQGRVSQDLGREVGDFVLLRADGLFAYQLAVVVDDAAQGITDVVRGIDLIDSTPRQILLQRMLDLPTPRYLHLPIVTNAAGEKLSKQTGAAAIDRSHPALALVTGLRFLGQVPPPELERGSARAVLEWAAANWDRSRIPRQRTIVASPITAGP
ncbi:MAG TPA: tRNA glutamyl-Q(34) synthetase GluQRS [Burkholderiales bacterium]|nr:tRNA glutamyl-Q(34) synthetase GluQRS [Burkholderiales bacterium]